jgi:hypothetical protein
MKGSREEGNVLVEKQHSNTGNSVLEIEKTKQNQPNKNQMCSSCSESWREF